MNFKKKVKWLFDNGLLIIDTLLSVFIVLFAFIKMNYNVPYQDMMSLVFLYFGMTHMFNGLKTKKIINIVLGIGFLLFSMLYLYDYIMILKG